MNPRWMLAEKYRTGKVYVCLLCLRPNVKNAAEEIDLKSCSPTETPRLINYNLKIVDVPRPSDLEPC